MCEVGDRVLVRLLHDKAKVGILVEWNAGAAFICKESDWDDVVAGRRKGPFIGFPVSDVYAYDGRVLGEEMNWRAMRPYFD